MDVLKIAKTHKYFCPHVAEDVELDQPKVECALHHGCDFGRHCDLYVERLIHNVVKEYGFLK